MKLMSIVPAVSLALMTSLACGQAVEVKGVVDAVTVYRGQALVTREVPIVAREGTFEIVVTDLPARVIPSSLHADSPDGVQVRSVRYRTRPIAHDVREDVRKLDDAIAAAADRLVALARRDEVITENKAYLTSLTAFVAPTAQTELTRGVLNAQTLEQLSTYITGEREKLSTQELERAREAQKVEAEIAKLNAEKATITNGSQKVLQEAVLIVSGAEKGGEVKLHYLVDGATWEPSYTARADRGEMTLEYYAAIEQMSGEDWGDVQMTLSTATPTLMASAPKLTAMKVSLSQQAAEAAMMQAQSGYFGAKAELTRRQDEVNSRRNLALAAAPAGDVAGGLTVHMIRSETDAKLNESALSMQVLDLVAGARDDVGGGGRGGEAKDARREGLSITYALRDRTQLPSRADRQLVQIAAMPMKATFAKVATPVLTSFVYDEAKMTNDSQLVLLAGPLTAYNAGAFVGSSDLPTVLVGESFVVGLGIDSSLRATRELVSRTEEIQGGNRVVAITYRLGIENFAAGPAMVRVFDRLPMSADDQVRVTLASGPDLSADAEYVKTQRKENILRYDVQVAPASSGSTAAEVLYTFRMEYDKQMNLVGM
jgi:hypothetical protein